MEEEYFTLLEKAYSNIRRKESSQRFEVPQAKISQVKNKITIIENFSEIAEILRREEKHLAKFLSKELASSFIIENGKMILNRIIKKDLIDKKIEEYVKNYVFCRQCKQPDTKLEKKDKNLFLICEACGATNVLGEDI